MISKISKNSVSYQKHKKLLLKQLVVRLFLAGSITQKLGQGKKVVLDAFWDNTSELIIKKRLEMNYVIATTLWPLRIDIIKKKSYGKKILQCYS